MIDFEELVRELNAEAEERVGEDEIVIQSTSGSTRVSVSGLVSIRSLFQENNLAVSLGTEFFVDGAPVSPDYVVSPGTTIMAVGMVKGG